MPDRYTIPGAKELKPLMQGNLSRLCGLYSVLNGIQLALFPQRLGRPELQGLYLQGIRHLAQRRQLRSVIGVGMHDGAWLALAAELLAHLNDGHGTSFQLRPVIKGAAERDRQRSLAAIKKAIGSKSPVLISFGGHLDHYTVVSGYTERRLVLFDSSGLRWLEAINIGVGERSARRHWISSASTVAIFDDW